MADQQKDSCYDNVTFTAYKEFITCDVIFVALERGGRKLQGYKILIAVVILFRKHVDNNSWESGWKIKAD